MFFRRERFVRRMFRDVIGEALVRLSHQMYCEENARRGMDYRPAPRCIGKPHAKHKQLSGNPRYNYSRSH